MVRSRFAPSPTGYMTIGNLRTALYEYLIAKREGGVFILRLEDTDRQRYVEGATEAIYETLNRTGLHFDEGPGVGGAYGPYIQSERKDSYQPPALKMVAEGKAYYCFCPAERLTTLADERGLKKYDRHCLSLPPEEVQKRLDLGDAYVIRQLIPQGSTTFHDTVFGDITIENNEMEDQILIKSDGMPTYNFANVVDDHAMAITHVVRGCEYLTSTPKYVLLYEALGWSKPVFVHLPLLQNENGQKLSKRYGAPSILDMLSDGFLPEVIVNYAALLGWSPSGEYAEREIFTLEELKTVFDVKNISKSPSTFDLKKLTWMNGEFIKVMDAEDYYKLAEPYLKKAVPDAKTDIKKLAEITQSRVSFVKECGEMVDFFNQLPEYDTQLYTHKKMKTDTTIALQALQAVVKTLDSLQTWENDGLNQTMEQTAEQTGLKKGQILWVLRTALSGKPTSPCGGIDIALLLSKEETLKRLETGIKKCKDAVNG